MDEIHEKVILHITVKYNSIFDKLESLSTVDLYEILIVYNVANTV